MGVKEAAPENYRTRSFVLNKVCGQARRRDKYRGVFSVRPKAAPLQARLGSPIRRIAHSPTRHRHPHHPALVSRDSDIP
jgi:hypothetical protein